MRLFQRIQNEHALRLSPLRLVVLTAELGEAASRWQRALGLLEVGVSKQPEWNPVAKTISWGSDEECARSIILLTDFMAAAAVMNKSVAVTTIAHELGHVHGEFARGLIVGFPDSRTAPDTRD